MLASFATYLKFFEEEKITKTKSGGHCGPLNLQMASAQLCKGMFVQTSKYFNYQKEELISGVLLARAPFFGLNNIKGNKSLNLVRSKK